MFTFATTTDYGYPLAKEGFQILEGLIEEKIIEEAKKRLARYSQRQYYIHKYRRTFTKRTGLAAKASTHSLPSSWSFHKHFDPRYCINHSRFLARGVWSSLQAGVYEPTVALRTRRAKANGGFRYIDAFSIPDAVVASIFFSNLRKRNFKLFSDCSFAYQAGKTPLDAIIKLRPLFSKEKIYVSQYDFTKFFDSIEHCFIENALSPSGVFLTTKMERQIIDSVIRHRYDDAGTRGRRTVGTPQGHSISLFLANLAGHALDEELSRLNGSFARFADDCVVVNYSYEDATKCAETFFKFSEKSGVQINRDKSSGIRIFSNARAEIASVDHFDFLSYRFTPSGLAVSEKSMKAIKARCSRIIYNHLLLHPRRVNGRISPRRIGGGFRDWDLVTCINELRNFIYGGLTQLAVDQYLTGGPGIGTLSGAVSYFCLVEQSEQFRSLDGWLADVVRRALRERRRLMKPILRRKAKMVNHQQLLDGSWYKFPPVVLETRLPSFFLAWRAARKSWAQHGLGGVDTVGMGYNY